MSKRDILNRLENKHIIEDRPAAPQVQSMQPQDLSSTSATAQLQEAIEQEKARRVSRSRPLEVVQYEPTPADQARHFVEGWHLLFFARSGSTHIQELRAGLQQENERDLHLLSYVQKVQAQYGEYMARYTQAHRESVQGQEVIAEIRYGGLSLIPAFWLPEEMELGLSLLPRTGARLPTDALTLVEHAQPAASGSLDVLLVTAPASRTRAELATEHFVSDDFLSLQKQDFTFSTPALAGVGLVGATLFAMVTVGEIGVVAGAVFFGKGGFLPTRPLEERGWQQAERVRSLGDAPSSSQLLSARQRMLSGQK